MPLEQLTALMHQQRVSNCIPNDCPLELSYAEEAYDFAACGILRAYRRLQLTVVITIFGIPSKILKAVSKLEHKSQDFTRRFPLAGVTKVVSQSLAGFLLQKELDYLDGAVKEPKRPFAAIVGGSKVLLLLL